MNNKIITKESISYFLGMVIILILLDIGSYYLSGPKK